MKKTERLPRKLSDLINVGLKDLRAVERTKKYFVNMGTFHAPEMGSKRVYDAALGAYVNVPKVNYCAVCFAGAVMAKSLKAAPDEIHIPRDFGPYNEARLNALDFIRMGNLSNAFEAVGRPIPAGIAWDLSDFTTYDADPVAFKSQLAAVAKTLAKLGE